MIITGGVTTDPGVYTTFNGHIDNSAKLQDDFFCQDFSYVIRSPVSFNVYEQVVSDPLHPTRHEALRAVLGFSELCAPHRCARAFGDNDF
jgi:hypothetical protein